MTDIVRPGCYGSVILHDLSYTRCKICPAAMQCKAETEVTRALLDAEFASRSDGGRPSAVDKRKAEKRAIKRAAEPSPTPPASETRTIETETPAEIEPARPGLPGIVLDGVAVRLDGLPKKVGETITRWANAGVRVSDLKSGENPFANTGFTIHSDVCAFLVDRKRCDRQEIKVMLMTKRGHSDGTASSQAKIVLDSLHALGLVDLNGTLATLRGA